MDLKQKVRAGVDGQSFETRKGENSFIFYIMFSGPGSSVGIATDYGLDGPGPNPGGDEIS